MSAKQHNQRGAVKSGPVRNLGGSTRAAWGFLRRYAPDFIVEHIHGHRAILEVKGPSRVDSDEVKRKRKAAEMGCKRRGIEYIVATVD